MIWLATLARAADPTVLADPLRPALDAGPFATVESGFASRHALVAAQSSWIGRPIRLLDADGTVQPVIRHALAIHLGVRSTHGPLQLGLNAPVYPLRVGNREPRVQSVLGDPSVDAVLATRRRWGALGAVARFGVPLGASEHQLGYPGPFGDLGGLVTLHSPITLAANLGIRFTPTQTLGALMFDDAFWWRVGASVPVGPGGAITAEALGSVPRTGATIDAAPVEVLATGRHLVAAGLTLWAGGGRGIAPGVGAPAWRVVAGLQGRLGSQVDLVDP